MRVVSLLIPALVLVLSITESKRMRTNKRTSGGRGNSTPALHGLADFPVGVALLHVLAFVAGVLAFAKAEEDFEALLGVEIALEGNEGFAGRGDFLVEASDFFLVDEEASEAFGFVVLAVAFFVGGDVELVDPHLAIFDAGKGFVEAGLAGAEGFDFGALELDAGFEGFEDGVVAAGLAVVDFQAAHGRP
jgi:hypothetical protein